MIHKKLSALMSPVEKIARVASAGVIKAKSHETSPSGTVSYDNADGTRTVIGPAVGDRTVATHVGDTAAPPIPKGVSAWSGDGSLHVSWDGTLDGEVPADFDHVTILVDGSAVGELTAAGSITVNGLAVGSGVSVAATAEDDCCLADGTPAHNVSEPCAAISVEIRDAVAEVRADADAHGEQIEAVRSDVAGFKAMAAATYSTKSEVDEKTGAITKTLSADYTKTADLAATDAVKDAKKAGTDAQSQLAGYKSAVSETYAEKTELTQAVNQLTSTMSSNYSAFTDYRTSNDMSLSKAQTAANDAQNSIDNYKTANDKAVADAKSAGTTAQNQLSSYKSSNDQAVAAAKKAGTDAQSNLDSYKTTTDKKLGELSNIANNAIESWYLKGAPTTSNAPAKSWTTDALKSQHAGDLYMDVDTGYSYRWSGTAWVQVKDSDVTKALNEVQTIKTDYATKSELKSTDTELSGKISESLTTAKGYADGKVAQEVTDRNAAIKAQADSISLSVSKTYTKAETFAAYQSDADQRIATANSNASTAVSTARTAASDAATAKTNASAAGKAAADVQSDLDGYKGTVAGTYATKSSLELANESISTEVKARAELSDAVSDLSTTVSQTADSITASVTSLARGGVTYVDATGQTVTSKLGTQVQQTAKDVTTAIDIANGTAMLIRSDSTGVTVGKSTDGGKTFPSGRTRIDSDSFDVLDNDGNVVATLSKNTLSMLAGMFKIKTEVQTPDGGTAEYYDTIISDGDVTFGDGYIDRSYIGFESRLADDWKKRDSIVNIQSASGDGIGGSSLSVSPSGIGLFGEVKVEGKSGASGLQIGGNGTTIAGLFFGSKVVSADAGEARLWTPSEFESAFGRKFDFTRDYVGVMNADAGVNGGYGVSVATYWSSGNIWVGGSGVVPGTIRVNYLVILG